MKNLFQGMKDKFSAPAASGSDKKVIKDFYSNVVGAAYTNEDGTSRQSYIVKLKPGDALFFKPAPTKEHPDSVGVFTSKKKQIGVVNYSIINELRGKYAHNNASVTVHTVDNSERGLSVNMHIVVYG